MPHQDHFHDEKQQAAEFNESFACEVTPDICCFVAQGQACLSHPH
jgi:hypothetical protein